MGPTHDTSASTWSGADFLGSIGGTADVFPPVRVLFLAARLRDSGRLWLTHQADIRTIDLSIGEVVGCSGFSGLLDPLGIQGEINEGLSELVQRGIADGHAEEEVLEIAAQSLGRWLVEHSGNTELIVQYAPNAPQPEQPVSLPMSCVQMVAAGVDAVRTQPGLQEWIAERSGDIPAVVVPSDTPRDQWGLGEAELGMLDAIERVAQMEELASIGIQEWQRLTLLIELGLVEAKAETDRQTVQPTAKTDPLTVEPSPIAPTLAAESASGTAPLRRRKASGSKRTNSASMGRKFQPLDPVVALGRAPWESPQMLVETHLNEAFRALNESSAEVVLGLYTLADLETRLIETRFRELCARYHPDRYLGSTQAVRTLAQGCFSRVADAYHQIGEGDYMERLKARFEYAETGKRPVNDRTRMKARVEFKRAEMLFRQRRFPDAAALALKAKEGDPDRMEYALLYIRVAWSADEMDTDTAVKGILALQGMPARAEGEAHYLAGEMLLRDGRVKEASMLFKRAVETDPENVGARRRLRLQERRKAAAADKDKPERKGVFGSLFDRRKR